MFWSVCSVRVVPNRHSSATLTEGFACFSSVVRQMPEYNWQRQGTAWTVHKLTVLFCVLSVCKCVLCCCHRVATKCVLCCCHRVATKCVLYCCHRVATKCELYCCHRVATQLQLINISNLCYSPLTFTLLTWRIGWAPNNARKLQMGFNFVFEGLNLYIHIQITYKFNTTSQKTSPLDSPITEFSLGK